MHANSALFIPLYLDESAVKGNSGKNKSAEDVTKDVQDIISVIEAYKVSFIFII